MRSAVIRFGRWRSIGAASLLTQRERRIDAVDRRRRADDAERALHADRIEEMRKVGRQRELDQHAVAARLFRLYSAHEIALAEIRHHVRIGLGRTDAADPYGCF